MKRPPIKDKKVLEYVEKLEEKLKNFNATTTKVKSYLALKHFIDNNSETLGKVDMSSDILSDKEDKLADRASKFFKDLKDLNATLDSLGASINPEEITEGHKKLLKESGVSVEELLSDGIL